MALSPRLLRPRSTLHPEALAWRTAVTANGGSVSGTTLSAVSKFCKDIVSAGIRNRFYRLNLFAGTGLSAALVPLYRGPAYGGTSYGNATDTNVNFVSGDYVETGSTGGLNADGATKYLDTGLQMFSAGLVETDTHAAGYFRDALATTGLFLGTRDAATGATKGFNFYPSFGAGGGMYFRSGGLSGSGIENGAIAASSGFLSAARTPSGAGYRNGSNISAASSTAGSVAWAAAGDTPSLYVFQQNAAPGPAAGAYFFGKAQMYSVGKGMTDAQMLAFYNAVQAFQTSLTRNL